MSLRCARSRRPPPSGTGPRLRHVSLHPLMVSAVRVLAPAARRRGHGCCCWRGGWLVEAPCRAVAVHQTRCTAPGPPPPCWAARVTWTGSWLRRHVPDEDAAMRVLWALPPVLLHAAGGTAGGAQAVLPPPACCSGTPPTSAAPAALRRVHLTPPLPLSGCARVLLPRRSRQQHAPTGVGTVAAAVRIVGCCRRQ